MNQLRRLVALDVASASHPSTARPTPASARIEPIDALRGFALLGILLMNIIDLALPRSALIARGRLAPSFLADHTGLSFPAWLVEELMVRGVMRAIFCMLFGAGVVLFSTRRAERFDSGEVADAYYRRTIWLVVFGLVHAFILLGWWDILFVYGVAGMFLYSFRRLRPRWLILIGVLVLSVPLPLALRDAVSMHATRAAAARVGELARSGKKPDADLRRQADEWAETVARGRAEPDAVQSEIETRRSGYWANFRQTAWINFEMQSSYLYEKDLWDAAGMMFLGMALLKLEVLTGIRSRRSYMALAVVGFAIGLTINYLAVLVMVSNGFDPWSVRLTSVTHDAGRLSMALGYIGITMLAFRSPLLGGATRTLSAVGRMALTNYLLQTIIGVLLFYGFGFGWFARFELVELLWPVIVIWTLQLIFSPMWLRRYRFGPVEWLWRCLTYGRLQPFRRADALAGTPVHQSGSA